jgi:hypothetical protein
LPAWLLRANDGWAIADFRLPLELAIAEGSAGSFRPILESVFLSAEKMDQQDPEDYPVWGYAALNEFKVPRPSLLRSRQDGAAAQRSEANRSIANGLELNPCDEILLSDQQHPGGEHPWNPKAKRYGIVVKKVTLPRPV